MVAVNVDLIHYIYSTGMLWWKKTYTEFYFLDNGRWYKIGETMNGQIEEDIGPQLSTLVRNGKFTEVKDPYMIKSLGHMLRMLSK